MQKSPSAHNRTNLSGYIFATKTYIDYRKKILKQQCLLHMSSQYGELRPTSGWDRSSSLGHPCKFQRVSRLGSVTARHSSSGLSQTLRRWTEGATYIRQGGHHVGHWPTFLVTCVFIGANRWWWWMIMRRCRHSMMPDAWKTFRYASLHIKSPTSTMFAAGRAHRPHTASVFSSFHNRCCRFC